MSSISQTAVEQPDVQAQARASAKKTGPDRPHVAAFLAFSLGVVFTLCAVNAVCSPAVVPSSAWRDILQSRALALYGCSWAVFHLLEYLTTAAYNPSTLTVDSFLLNNGRHYHIAHSFAIIEYVLTCRLAPHSLVTAKAALLVPGFCMVLAAQALRSSAMATAATGFTHVIATKKRDDHVLVTTGVYAWTRHPSYVGFTYWALGTQTMLGNPVSFVGFGATLWYYFSHRIEAEERYLQSFFGPQYAEYKQKVPTRLPFIP